MAVAGVSPSCQPVRAGAGPYRHALSSAALPASVVTKMTLLTRGQLIIIITTTFCIGSFFFKIFTKHLNHWLVTTVFLCEFTAVL